MTNNQTIDGVPRELLLRVCDPYRPKGQDKARAELRALLDATDHVHEWDINAEGTATVCHCGARSSDETATQPQGEPALYVARDSIDDLECDGMHATRKPNELQCVALYLEQPAPVAVASRDESIYWLNRIDGIGQARAELIYSMGFRRHTEVPQS